MTFWGGLMIDLDGVQVTCLMKRTPTPSTGSYKVTDWVSVEEFQVTLKGCSLVFFFSVQSFNSWN